MATEKKSENLSVEERLKALYELQTILSEIDRIKIVRGELPIEVQDLEDDIARLQTRIANFKAEIEEVRKKLGAEKAKIEESKMKIVRYKEQINNVS
ncbi:MAG: hypothetical protein ACI30S_02850, partial [Muribaculaceae bacterium]